MTTQPPPEIRAILKEWVEMQREKYGKDWKTQLTAEMVQPAARLFTALDSLRRKTG